MLRVWKCIKGIVSAWVRIWVDRWVLRIKTSSGDIFYIHSPSANPQGRAPSPRLQIYLDRYESVHLRTWTTPRICGCCQIQKSFELLDGFCFCSFVYFFETRVSLSRKDRLQSHRTLIASASQVLKWKACDAMPCFCCFWDRGLMCRSGWPWTHNLLASASQVKGLYKSGTACQIDSIVLKTSHWPPFWFLLLPLVRSTEYRSIMSYLRMSGWSLY